MMITWADLLFYLKACNLQVDIRKSFLVRSEIRFLEMIRIALFIKKLINEYYFSASILGRITIEGNWQNEYSPQDIIDFVPALM